MFSASKSGAASTGYNLTNSLRFRSSASAFLSRTPGSAGNRRIWTWSGWVKRGQLSAQNGIFSAGTSFGVNNNNLETISFPAGDTLEIASEVSGSTQYRLITTQLFRDPSAWYHIIVAVDTTQATASNRIKLYVNGSQVTAFGTSTYPSQNYDCWTNSTNAHRIGSRASPDFDGYMDEINFIDGQALTPSSFGSFNATTGVWQPARYTGTYGTNGFYLNFTDIALTSGSNTGLGRDFSGNGNFWNTNNISVTAGVTYDAMTDVPTNTSATTANYCVLNPLRFGAGSGSTANVSEANLRFTCTGNAGSIIGTMNIPSTGKYYWEAVVPTQTFNFMMVGVIANQESLANLNSSVGDLSTGYSVYTFSGRKFNNGANSPYMAVPSQNTVVTIAYDADTGSLFVGAGGSWANGSGSTNQTWANAVAAYTGITGNISPAISFDTGNCIVNFGQRPFSYTPPTGFNRLNTYNLPDSTIKKGNTVMDAYIYTGDGNSTRTITFPIVADFVWSKNRTTANDNVLIDTVRGGTSPVRALFSNATTAEITTTAGWGGFGYPDSLSGTSYAVVKGTQATSYTNKLNDSYVNWLWQAGQGSTSSNTSGSITSTVSVNATAGFSVVTWAGTSSAGTIGHGLGVAPRMIIIKGRNYNGGNWGVYHASLGNTSALYLNLTLATTSSAAYWNNTSPTSTVFSIGTGNADFNSSSYNYVGYCWAEIAGFSRFGSYTGNSSSDGPFVYLGFRPKFIMIKVTTTTDDWYMYDTSRNTANLTNLVLFADLSNAEATATTAVLDILSNGFKIRGSAGINAAQTYIYMAFAENPFKNALAR
jgi:hypothetical protein